MLDATERPKEVASRLDAWVGPAFCLSGFAALLYQVVWQRALYAVVGINIESTTIVVTAFMLGLGFGGLLGGAIAGRVGQRIAPVFAMLELFVAIYGWFSLRIIRASGEVAASVSLAGTATLTLALLILPTLCMGATLPLLVTHRVHASKDIGTSISTLYFVNTAGSAFASIAAAVLIMRALGEAGATRLAALINIVVAGIIISGHLATRTRA
jgi:spermidine synthase